MDGSITFEDYVEAEFVGRANFRGEPTDFFLRHGMEKVKPGTAAEIAWQYAEQGAALGAICPEIVRKMFEWTHAAVPKGDWELARSAGLNIPREQDPMSYDETEKGEDEVFSAYCQECFPDLLPLLTS